MQFTGKNLKLVQMAIEWAISDVHGQIGSCPDVFIYKEDIEELERMIAKLEILLAKVKHAVKVEE